MSEKSCGAVIFKRDNGKIKVLSIKALNDEFWGFPKGHTEEGETEEETALREVREETGLNVRLLDGFKVSSHYTVKENVPKEVVFFCAEIVNGDVQIQREEVEDYKWGTVEEISEILTYEADKKILRAARVFIMSRHVL